MDPRRARKLVGERGGEILRAEDVQHSFQVVDHGRQADFCLCATQSAQQETRVSEDPVLQGGEGMLDDRLSQPHYVCRGPLLHPL